MNPALLSLGAKLIDRLIPDKIAKDEAKLKLIELQMNGELAQLSADTELARGQMGINQQEAAHEKLFVAGWRPSIGWICSAGLAYQFVLAPILGWVALMYGIPVPPPIDMGTLLTLLMGMLGLGGFRTYEKLKGVNSNH